MSRTRHKEKRAKIGVGREYWKSRLHSGGEATGKYTKRLTARKERREAKNIQEEK